MIAYFDEIKAFAQKCFDDANTGATAIQFSLSETIRSGKAHGTLNAQESYSIGHSPRFLDLETSRGVGGWAVVLSVDLRGSSKRAVEIGAEDTYLTMHTYLPTMAELVTRARGKVASLRGDGLFAVFGFTEYKKGQQTVVSQEKGEQAIRGATKCGKAMIEATTQIINPIMVEHDIQGQLRVGIGICVGDVVVTQIGVEDAVERTLYGAPVNNACKASGRGTNEMILTNQAKSIYPKTKGGQTKFKPINLGGSLGGQIFLPSSNFVMLEHRSSVNPKLPR